MCAVLDVLLSLALLSSVPLEDAPLNVGILEVNTVVNSDGEVRLEQCIFRLQSGEIVAWRYLENVPVPKKPWLDFLWQEKKVFRRFAGWRIDTKTNYDPEMAERDFLPERFRRGLQ